MVAASGDTGDVSGGACFLAPSMEETGRTQTVVLIYPRRRDSAQASFKVLAAAGSNQDSKATVAW